MPKVSPEYLEARRQQILDAALTCFDRAGFHGTSMQDIFNESGLSTGAVYRYFASKDDIVEALAEQRHTREAALIGEAMQVEDLRAALHRLADLYFEWVTDPEEQRRRRLGVQIWAEAVHNPRIRAVVQRGADQRLLLAGRLQEAQRRRALAPGVDPEAMTRVYLALFQGFLVQQAWQPNLDVAGYLGQLHFLIDATMPGPTATPPATGTASPSTTRKEKTR
jgi:AcrR family transcriptional regulator